MIVREFYRQREDGVNLYRTYSDENYKIRFFMNGIYQWYLYCLNFLYKRVIF